MQIFVWKNGGPFVEASLCQFWDVEQSSQHVLIINQVTDTCRLQLFEGYVNKQIYGLVQDCSNSIALAMELLQSCIKPLK